MTDRRPPSFNYSLRKLANLPRRLFHPPSPSVGKVRSCAVQPLYDVSLHDVLQGKHSPPLTLKDFEDYLVYLERSAENLYFLVWLKEYTQEYEKWENTCSPQQKLHTSPTLALSFARAKQTFFSSHSLTELNLLSSTLSALLSATPSAHPPPSAFLDVTHEVEQMLQESLRRFVSQSCKNAGSNRKVFGISVALSCIFAGLGIILWSIVQRRQRWIRALALPLLWCGFAIMFSTLCGVCIVIFFFGDARQLYPFELQRVPNIPENNSTAPQDDNQLVACTPSDDHGVTISPPFPADANFAPEACSPSTAISPFLLEFRECTESPYRSEFVLPPYIPPRSCPLERVALHRRAEEEARKQAKAKQKEAMRGGHTSPMFADLTTIESSVVMRVQWEVMVRAIGMGFVMAAVITGGCLVPPVRVS